MKILSLFDGMSVAQQALKELGIPVETYYASEIDPYAIAVTQANHPKTKQIGDVTYISTPEGLSIFMPDIDLMIGGSPCQDLSIAKKDRKGLDGERSGLFWKYVEILKYVKPKYFILENVASMPKEAKQIISEALGVQPVMINASLVSAQNRKRLFWVGKWNGEKYEQVDIPQPKDRGILLKDILEENVDEKYYLSEKLLEGFSRKTGGFQFNPMGKDKEKSKTLTARYFKMSATDPYIKETLRIGQLNSGGQGDRIYSQDGKSTALSANGGGRGAKTGLYAVPVALRNRGEGKKPEYNGTDKANAMTSVQTDSMVEENQQIRKLTPTECLRLQSMPDDYFDKAEYKGKPISNTQRYKMCGNAFNCEVVKHIITFLI